MSEVHIIMSLIQVNTCVTAQRLSNAALWVVKGSTANLFLTNGQSSPTHTISPGAWSRFRFVFSGDGMIMILSQLSKSGNASCQWQLLAKDGIYLNTAPRLITKAYFAQASRADIAIQCTGIGSVNLIASTQVAAVGARVTSYVALTLNVNGTSANQAALPSFSVYRPCYLANTLNSTPTKTSTLTLGTGNPNAKLNGIYFSSPTQFLDTFVVGTLNEIVITQGIFVHTFHLHVNPYQITYMLATADNTYFQVGGNCTHLCDLVSP
jgi:hypothetical protein